MVIGSSVQCRTAGSKSLLSSKLQSFCQLQVKQLIIQYPIIFARIVYYDPISKTRQEVIDYERSQSSFSQQNLAYLKSEEWLSEFPPVLTLNEMNVFFTANCYICPIGYRNQQPEYIQILTEAALPVSSQNYVKQCALLLSYYLDSSLECEQHKSEIQLLEEIIQRAGHQLRNNLGLIGLYAQNLYLSLKNESWQGQASIICESIQELDSNLTELIYCGQSTKLRVSLQDLRNLVLDSLKNLQPLIHQKNLQVSLSDSSTLLEVDCVQIKQVFDNLLSNAVHFSPQDGTITCSWQVFQSEVLIKISDRGAGLSQQDLQKIFTPFYSRREGGTGLGLTIAKKIILDHQGSIWGQNLPIGGAQFSLILPRNKAL